MVFTESRTPGEYLTCGGRSTKRRRESAPACARPTDVNIGNGDLAVKWQYKARLQNAIAALPFGSNAVYYAVQRSVGGLRKGRINPLSRIEAAAKVVRGAESFGFDVRDKTVLEIGTGRTVDLPTGMWLCGARRIITVDLNRYLSPTLISEGREFLRKHREAVISIFDRRDDSLFEERLNILLGKSVADEDLLRTMSVEYMSPADAANLPLKPESVDLHVSYAVMEHIPPDVVSGILDEARRVMRLGGLLLHTIDPSDHFSHDDPTISRINFLRFSEPEWEKWAGNKFMYHNRLRASELVRLFEGAGVHILKEERSVDEVSLATLNEGFPLDRRFASFSPEDLATTTISLMGSFEARAPLR